MRKFLIKSSILSGLIILIHFALIFTADGYTDPYYAKLTSSKKSSLVLGGSRAYEGIIPTVFNAILSNSDENLSLYNFAFTNSDSPYGAVYLNAIEKKLNKTTTDGIFILSVHPWNISSLTEQPNDTTNFRENSLALSGLSKFNNRPNINYLINKYNYGWGNFILKKCENKTFEFLKNNALSNTGQWSFVHNDGWLEVKSMTDDSLQLEERMYAKIEAFKKRNINHSYKFSSIRLDYLNQTIKKLKQHGTVYLVRFPVHEEIINFEKKIMPHFDSLINNVSSKNDVKYFNFTAQSKIYKYSDGNHFLKESAENFSVDIAKLIQRDRIK